MDFVLGIFGETVVSKVKYELLSSGFCYFEIKLNNKLPQREPGLHFKNRFESFVSDLMN